MTISNDTLILRVEARAEFGLVYLRVPPTLAAEVTDVVRDAGAEPGRVGEFSLEPVHVVVGVTAAPGIWLNLRAAITALSARHRDKTFRLELSGGESIEANGHSARDVERLLKAAAEVYAEREARHEEWRRRATEGSD